MVPVACNIIISPYIASYSNQLDYPTDKFSQVAYISSKNTILVKMSPLQNARYNEYSIIIMSLSRHDCAFCHHLSIF